MIVGSGSIANLLNDRNGFIFFASGVGDSAETKESEFKRERDLFQQTIYQHALAGPHVVYFSTISIFTTLSPYTIHKMDMEKLVKKMAYYYTIIRLGNVWGCRNPNTFVNKMEHWERNNKLLDSMIRDEYKFMVSKEQINMITDHLPRNGKNEISIFGEMLKVKECLERSKKIDYV